MAANDQNYTLGRGKVHFARFTDTTSLTPGGFRYIGNTPEFNLTIETEELDHFNSDEGIREKDCTITLEVTRAGSMVTDNINRENLSMFFYGDHSELTVAAATGLTETLTGVTLGQSYKLGRTTATPSGVFGIDESTFAVRLGGNPTTYTANTDYVLDANTGMLTILETGAIAANADLDITYDLRASTRERVISGDVAQSGAMFYEARNAAGKQFSVYMPYVSVKPNGDFNLKSDEWQQIPFNLEILKAPGLSAIYIDGEPAYA